MAGALEQVIAGDEQQPRRPGMEGVRQMAYGDAGSPFAGMTDMIKEMMPKDDEANGWRSFAAGVGAPTKTGALTESLAAGLGAQTETKLKESELKAKYVPLIMQSILQGQAQAIAAAKAQREMAQQMHTTLTTALYGTTAAGGTPSYQDLHDVLLNTAHQNQYPTEYLAPYIQEMQQAARAGVPPAAFAARKSFGAVPAEKQQPVLAQNAAGQSVGANPSQGGVQVLGSPPAGGGGAATGANPSKPTVEAYSSSLGDPKAYENELRNGIDVMTQVKQRMNAVGKFMEDFTPGRYVNQMGGVAAAITDMANRLPKALNKDFVNNLVGDLLGGDPAKALAAKQVTTQLMKQEAVAQAKAINEAPGANALGRNVFNAINASSLGEQMTPEAFAKLNGFLNSQTETLTHKYKKWSEYADANSSKPGFSVRGFDAPYTAGMAKHIIEGNEGPYLYGEADSAPKRPEPPVPGATRREPTAAAPAVAPATPAAVDLSLYEPKARVSPTTGAVYVLDPKAKGGFRLAVLRQKGSGREVSGKLQ